MANLEIEQQKKTLKFMGRPRLNNNMITIEKARALVEEEIETENLRAVKK
ncbi:MAG: hypothetical protein C5S38_03980 [Candidatus Methanophagaceae archaeon]|nr:MAG: hypothetical protein C5S38_03980 [Methanophagales archaeon]KAF5430860.1 hypothetical protein C5S36_12040 [Methanophagales archaeon]